MKRKNYIFIFLVIIIALLSSCRFFYNIINSDSESTESNLMSNAQQQNNISEKIQEKKILNYIALGDSIARGAALDEPAVKCYPYQLSLLFKAVPDISDVSYENYAVDGQTTQSLLALLSENSKITEDADIITISIGANNILGVFLNKMTSIFEYYDIPKSAIYNTGEIFKEILSGTAEQEYYQKVLYSFSSINTYVQSDEFATEIETAATQLESDLPKIIDLIRRDNKKAKIAINTIYNPYKNLSISIGNIIFFSPAEKTNEAIDALNSIIISNAKLLDYTVIPVYTSFTNYKGPPRLENAFFDLLSPQNTNIDVHPSEEGHKVIAELVFTKLEPFLSE